MVGEDLDSLHAQRIGLLKGPVQAVGNRQV